MSIRQRAASIMRDIGYGVAHAGYRVGRVIRSWSSSVSGCGCDDDDADLCEHGDYACSCACHLELGGGADERRAA